MVAIREKAIGYINEMPEERLAGVVSYLQFLVAQKHPLEITSKEELYREIDKGLDDIEHGRVRPFEDAMDDILDSLRQRMEQQ